MLHKTLLLCLKEMKKKTLRIVLVDKMIRNSTVELKTSFS